MSFPDESVLYFRTAFQQKTLSVTDARDYRGNTLIHHAIFLQDNDLLNFFLTQLTLEKTSVADFLCTQNEAGRTPLHEATLLKNQKIFGKILSLTPTVALEVKDKPGRTALHLACLRDDKDKVKSLLKAGASIDTTTDATYQNTPLHFAIQRACHRVASMLLKNGAAVNAYDAKEKKTPLDMLGDLKQRTLDLTDIEWSDSIERKLQKLLTQYHGLTFESLEVQKDTEARPYQLRQYRKNARKRATHTSEAMELATVSSLKGPE